MYVEVLLCDMKRARPANIYACPVSRAIRRQMLRAKNDVYVLLDGRDLHIGEVTLPLPREVVEWVSAFDDGESVPVPFDFHLDVPVDLSLEYVRGRMLALSCNTGERTGDMRTLKQVVDAAQAQARDLDDFHRAA